MNRFFKFLFAVIFVLIVMAAGFTFSVREGFAAVVTRFGKIVNVHNQSGLHYKLPWPIDTTVTYDMRNQYFDSGYAETLTNDKVNIILQTYIIWRIKDPEQYHIRVGNSESAQRLLNGIVADTKNSVMGDYGLSALVSTDLSQIKINDISEAIMRRVAALALSDYGIEVTALKIKRLGFPDANIASIYEQMIADRQKIASQYTAEGERDSAIIISEANAEAAKIIAQGKLEASEIDAETERMIAEIYGEAYDKNSELFIFLKKLIALENSANPDTILIMRSDESPFDVLIGAEGAGQLSVDSITETGEEEQ